jgi:hypothetical protein
MPGSFALVTIIIGVAIGVVSSWIPKPAKLPFLAVGIILVVLVLLSFAIGKIKSPADNTGSSSGGAALSSADLPSRVYLLPTASSAPSLPPTTAVVDAPTTADGTPKSVTPPPANSDDLLGLSIQWTTADRHDVNGKVTFQPTGSTTRAEEAYAPELADPDGSYAYPADCFVATRIDNTSGTKVKDYPSEPCNDGQIDLGSLNPGNYVLVATAEWTGGSKVARSAFSVLS